jgi:hypothetical protein
LCQSWEKYYGDPHNDSTSLRGLNLELYTGVSPCEFFLFPKMKLKLTGHQFDTIEEIQAESQRVLDTLTENEF